jgi:hypothetical protein
VFSMGFPGSMESAGGFTPVMPVCVRKVLLPLPENVWWHLVWCSNIKLLAVSNKTAILVYDNVDKSSCKKITHGHIFEWHKKFPDGWEEVYDNPTYGEPKPKKMDEDMEKLWKSVSSYHHLMIRILELWLTCWTWVWNQFWTMIKNLVV